jgi:hypothetical protein
LCASPISRAGARAEGSNNRQERVGPPPTPDAQRHTHPLPRPTKQQQTKQPDLKDTLQACTRAQLTPFADGVLAQVQRALETLHQQQQQEEDEDGAALATTTETTAMHVLRLCANLAAELLRALVASESSPGLPSLCQTVLLLHDHALLELGERADVQDAVAQLCCAWWRASAPDRERLLSQALPYLLIRALASGKPGHVRACNDMREGLELLDYDDEDIADLRRLLLHAARSPHFLNRPEGRSFLATVLTLHPLIVREFTAVVRSMASTGRRQVLDAYGDVVLRGWRGAQGACLHEIETTLIQDGLALAALRASTPALAASLRQILSHLHNAKRFGAASAGATDALLVRLYEPVLFRDLDAANGAVRRNALRLLLDCFPLADPEASDEDGDALMRRQFAALSAALADECPGVRAVAAVGTGAVLDRYWEMVPTATCAVYVGRLASELAFDASSPAVRAAAVQGLASLVDNVRAQPVLRAALPRLAPLSQDAAPAVRSALAALLLRATTSRELRFWDVVPLERLLDALVAEAGGGNGGMATGGSGGGKHDQQQQQQQQPSRQLTEAGALLFRVLAPSYVPPTGTSAEGEAPARVAALLRRHPAAGQTLCRLLAASLEAGGGVGGGSWGTGAAASCGLSVPAPLEAVVALSRALAAHLLSTPPEGWVDPAAAAEGGSGASAKRAAGGSPPRKQAKGGRKAAAAAATAATAAGHKRRKQPAAAGKKGAEDEEEEEDVLVAAAAGNKEGEAADAWAAILGGLAELCSGLGSLALAGDVAGPEDVAAALPTTARCADEQQPPPPGKRKAASKKGASSSTSGGKAGGSGSADGSSTDAADGGPLQRLLAMAPTQGARRAVWRIAAALPWCPASASLRTDALARVASGELLPAAAQQQQQQASAAATTAEEAAAAAALAALAGPQSGAKLAAMLCEAAGVAWEPTSFDAPEEEEDEEQQGQEEEDNDDGQTRCLACTKSKPDATLLLCDGCDAAFHTGCLDPALPGIPRGDWLCPGCASEVRAHGRRMGAEGALAHASLLLAGGGAGGGPAGRELLRRSGALRRLLPAAEDAAGEASDLAEDALRRLPRGQLLAQDPEAAALMRAAGALDAAALWARAGLHSLVAAGSGGGGAAAADAEAAVREAAAAVLGAAECGASTVKALAAWVEEAGGAAAAAAAAPQEGEDDDEAEQGDKAKEEGGAKPSAAPSSRGGRRRRDEGNAAAGDAAAPATTALASVDGARAAALAALARWLGLLGDALRLRGFGEPLALAPAAVVAASGRAALAALDKGSRRGGPWRAHREAVGRALAADAALLKLLLAAEATGKQQVVAGAASSAAPASASAEWSAELLQALAVKPLAPLAPALSRDVNAVVALLLEEEQGQQQRRRDARDDDDGGVDDGEGGSAGAAVAAAAAAGAAAPWMRALAMATASALMMAASDKGKEAAAEGGSDGDDDADANENADPQAPPPVAMPVSLPPMVVAALAAARVGAAAAGPGGRRRAPAAGSGAAFAQAAAEAAVDAGRRGDWAEAAGALRLARTVAAAAGAVAADASGLRRADALRALRTSALGAATSGKAAAAAMMAATEVDLLVSSQQQQQQQQRLG